MFLDKNSSYAHLAQPDSSNTELLSSKPSQCRHRAQEFLLWCIHCRHSLETQLCDAPVPEQHSGTVTHIHSDGTGLTGDSSLLPPGPLLFPISPALNLLFNGSASLGRVLTRSSHKLWLCHIAVSHRSVLTAHRQQFCVKQLLLSNSPDERLLSFVWRFTTFLFFSISDISVPHYSDALSQKKLKMYSSHEKKKKKKSKIFLLIQFT